MAKYAQHGTLTATTVATVTLTDEACDDVMIINHGTSGVIYATADGSTPTVAGDDTIAIPASSFVCMEAGTTTKTIKLICSTANGYSVQTSPFPEGD